jgi:hypothetical protein
VKVVLVMDVPEMGHFVPEALAKATLSGASTDIAPPWAYISSRQALARSMLTSYAAKFGAAIIDPLPAFCDYDHCDAARQGTPLFEDADHITATAARGISYLYDPVFALLSRRVQGSGDL